MVMQTIVSIDMYLPWFNYKIKVLIQEKNTTSRCFCLSNDNIYLSLKLLFIQQKPIYI